MMAVTSQRSSSIISLRSPVSPAAVDHEQYEPEPDEGDPHRADLVGLITLAG